METRRPPCENVAQPRHPDYHGRRASPFHPRWEALVSTTPDDVAPTDVPPTEVAADVAADDVAAPAPPRFYERPSLRRILWLTLFILAFFCIGLLFPPNFWRF
jgi:hypothetical protein